MAYTRIWTCYCGRKYKFLSTEENPGECEVCALEKYEAEGDD
jgi:hypothetical protein